MQFFALIFFTCTIYLHWAILIHCNLKVLRIRPIFSVPVLVNDASEGQNETRQPTKKLNPWIISNHKFQKTAEIKGVQLNRCISSLSRRSADAAIAEGRVTINSKVAEKSDRVNIGDVVRLDGQIQNWGDLAVARQQLLSADSMENRNFLYLKYWKPVGVTCTTDTADKTNIITAGKFNLFPQRLFTVGRLDKDSTGLILLTSDGRVNNAMLNPAVKKEKIYEVMLSRIPTDEDIKRLSDGVLITTTSQRDTYTKPITSPTLPCVVKRHKSGNHILQFVLTEGRNRQIRKMVEAIGYEVKSLHRVSFAGISLSGLSPGNYAELDMREMKIIHKAISAADSTSTSSSNSKANFTEYGAFLDN